MLNLLYPKAFNVPICTRCSSTIRVIVVKQTKAATKKNINGNNSPITPIRSESPLKETNPSLIIGNFVTGYLEDALDTSNYKFTTGYIAFASLENAGYKVCLTRNDENTDHYNYTNMYDQDGRITVACRSKAKLMLSLHIHFHN